MIYQLGFSRVFSSLFLAYYFSQNKPFNQLKQKNSEQGYSSLLSAEKTEDSTPSDKKLIQLQKQKYKPCLGKAQGYSCETCAVRSYCDGIPETKKTKA